MKIRTKVLSIAAALLLTAHGAWAQDGTAYAVTSLGEGAFMQSTLTSLQLPKKTLRVIGPYAFLECSGLTEIDVPETVK